MRASLPLSVAAIALAACTITRTSPPLEASPDGGAPAAATTVTAAEIACADSIDAVYGAPGSLDVPRGSVLKCAADRSLTREEVDTRLRANGVVSGPARSGARIYRILYRTERATRPASAGYSSGMVLLPDTPRAARVPVISVSHGAWGQSPRCTQSKQGFDGKNDSFLAMALGLVAEGFAVVTSDYAGFADYGAKGNPPSGMAFSEDVAKSTVDSLRAIRHVAPSLVTDASFLMGQSQGGHTVLSTLALAGADAPDVHIKGVVANTPLWFSQAAWSAIFLLGERYALERDAFPSVVGLWYLYSHGFLLDGEEMATDVFAKDKRAVVKTFFDENCSESHYDLLRSAAKLPADLYDPDFVEGVAQTAAFGGPCPDGNPRQKELCERWSARYAADRPNLTGEAAKVPILLNYGGKDMTIPKERAMCGINRLHKDRANLTVCFDPPGTHGSVVIHTLGHSAQWIASIALGEAAPPACEGDENAIVDETGAKVPCAEPPLND